MTHNETTIISGALDMTQKTAKDAMTPISQIFSLDMNKRLDEYVFIFYQYVILHQFLLYFLVMIYVYSRGTMSLILNRGHSRVPIYSGSLSNIIGLILVRAAENLNG